MTRAKADAGEQLAIDDSQRPGAMQVRLQRRVRGGLIEFESAPAGWLTQAGTPRLEDWRRYKFTPDETLAELFEPGKRVTMPSVTTLCGAVLSKEGLLPWVEVETVAGTMEAIRRGLVRRKMSDAEALAVLRDPDVGLGYEAARKTAAWRGISLHELLADFMLTGQLPDPADHPEAHRPYIQGLARWLLVVQPEPLAVEQLVCHPTAGYAGRLDLIARVGGKTILYDAKTNPFGQIFDAAHLQVTLLRDAEYATGDHEIDALRLVAFDSRGSFREMDCIAPQDAGALATPFYRAMKPVIAECGRQNQALKDRIIAELDA